MTTDPACSLCGSSYFRTWHVRERRFGSEDAFEVGECSRCPALILLNPPDDPGRYYPPEYPPFTARRRSWRAPIRRLRNRLLLGRRGPIRHLVDLVRPHPAARLLDRTGATPRSRVLDVGSGAGLLLEDLADAGFRHLVGVDRFIPQGIDGPRYRIVKGTLADIDEQFDLVMFHHSLEHMRNQVEALHEAVRVLAPGGWCVIRVPVFPSDAWDAYHDHWFQLDVPRHEYIHSVASLTRIARDAGLSLDGIEYDSTVHQFTGSESYRRGLTLRATDGYFPPAQLRRWASRVAEINARERGDQAVFYFRAAGSTLGSAR